ncbi:MAG: FMN-dependent NADH-azoreductase [Erythrobacter sp.]
MANLLYITTSINGADGVSRGFGDKLAHGLAKKSGARVISRDLAANDLPFVSAERFAANLTPPAERDARQAELAAIADELIAELQAADTIVIASPVYNFCVPATLKAWADLVARAGTTFKYTENGPVGLLTGKKAYLAISSGGTPMGADYDYMSPYLKHFLGFLGIEVAELIAADGMMGEDADAKQAAAHARVDELIG